MVPEDVVILDVAAPIRNMAIHGVGTEALLQKARCYVSWTVLVGEMT